MNAAQLFLTLLLRCYQRAASPALTALFGPMGLGCRYQPTCSDYAVQAVRQHGAARGTWLATSRVCRCHPWAGFGYDPVPDRRPSTADRFSP